LDILKKQIMKIQEIVFAGIERTDLDKNILSDDSLTLLHSYEIGQATRDRSQLQSVKFEKDHVVEFVFTDETTWIASPDTMDDLFPELHTSAKRSPGGAVELPVEIAAGTTDRSMAGKLLLKIVNIFGKKITKGGAGKLAEKLEDKQLEGKTGLYKVGSDFQLEKFIPEDTSLPYLLLIHGAASSFAGSFGDIRGTGLMDYFNENYTDRILAFQHRTLTHNPLQNLLDLVKALPAKCVLHLITTSRGGLVGDLLSRFCNSTTPSGFSSSEISILRSGYTISYFGKLDKLIDEIVSELKKKKIVVQKFVRIACPAGGTTLASQRLDFFFNITMNLIGVATGMHANPLYGLFRNLTVAVLECKNTPDILPGIEVLNPESPFIKAINCDTPRGGVIIDNSLVVIAANSTPVPKINPLRFIARRLFFPHKSDLVVDTRYMLMGTTRSGKIYQYLYEDGEINHFRYFSCRPTNQAIVRALKSEWGTIIQGFAEGVVSDTPKNRDFDLSAMGIDLSIPGIDWEFDYSSEQPPVKVSVSHGDLFYTKYPVLAGHFENDGILFAEKAIDNNLNEALTQRYRLGIYPGPIGTSEVFLNPLSGFKGAVIVGLGKPEELTVTELSRSVAQGVCNYLLNLVTKGKSGEISDTGADDLGISSLIIGSNYGGLPVADSLKAIVQGVHTANSKVLGLGFENPPMVRHIEFVELYEDIAVNAFYSLIKLESQKTKSSEIILEAKKIDVLMGSKKRIPGDITTGWWNRITIKKINSTIGEEVVRRLRFSVSTGSAHEKESDLFTNPDLIEGIISDMSVNNRWSPQSAKAIFELMIPNDFKEQLRRHGNINWILDYESAEYPWELLQDNVKDTNPLCVSAGMIRQLATDRVRRVIKPSPVNNVLVIADPDLKGFASQLPGALKEGVKVAEMMVSNGINTVTSFNGNPSEIIEKLFSSDYRIIHLSGHGEFKKDNPTCSGMVIGNNMFLSTREIKQMSTVPEVVFVNCCHIGKTSSDAEKLYQDRYKLAANIGTQLIENGVRCVIAAGWAVDDGAALEFAEVFYNRMFGGSNFGDAVFDARKAVYLNYGYTNTWGAYQCYGDPFYTFRQIRRGSAQQMKVYILPKEAEVDLANLLNDIEIGKRQTDDYINQLKSIQAKVEASNIRTPAITEKEAQIYFELRDYKNACEKFGSLLRNEDAVFSFSVAEKYYNAQAKLIISEFKEMGSSDISDPEREDILNKIGQVISNLEGLIKLSPTSQRYNILGSTYKRKALISIQTKKEDYISAAGLYHKGYENMQNWYSLTNWLSIESILVLSKIHKWNNKVAKNGMVPAYKLPAYDEVLALLDSTWDNHCKVNERMKYWDMLAGINLGLCRYIVQFTSNGDEMEYGTILKEIINLWKIAGSKGKRFAEIEHLEFLIDALDIEKNKKVSMLKGKLVQLKFELSQFI
jgi:hypothetical protein